MSGYRCECGRWALYGRCDHGETVGSIVKAYDDLGVEFARTTLPPWIKSVEARIEAGGEVFPSPVWSIRQLLTPQDPAGLDAWGPAETLARQIAEVARAFAIPAALVSSGPRLPRRKPVMAKNPNMARAVFSSHLYRLGFHRADKGRDPLVYEKVAADRRLDVQLWKDGQHRISHFLLCPHDHRRAVMSTHPTPFSNVAELDAAILHELNRTDHTSKGSW